MAETLEFKPLEPYNAGGNMEVHWYFNFYFRNPTTQVMERLKPTFNINRISDKINSFTQPLATLGNSMPLFNAMERAYREHVKYFVFMD